MIDDLMASPQDIREALIETLDQAWGRNSKDYRSGTLEDAEAAIRKSVGYALRMYWSGRTGKISRDLEAAYEWVTKNTLPAEVINSERRLQGEPRHYGGIMFKGVDHRMLEETAMDGLFAAYAATPGVQLPVSQETTGFFSRIFRR